MKKNFLLSALTFSLMLPTALPALPKKTTAKPASGQTRQTRPTPLGVSGGSTVDRVSDYCCSGTLGSLVQDAGGVFYILSNTHVLAGDSASGGNNKVSQKGDPINQPGYIDVNCQNRIGDYVAKLSAWAKIAPNDTSVVDAAIAEIMPGQVDTSGKILNIGQISSTPTTAFIGQKVKKNGRTTSFTTGKVSGLHASITVQYSTECGGSEFISHFENQILISPGSFIAGGDSGSLMVENTSTHPRPIGLLFAGSDSIAIANPIQDVLSFFDVEMVGVATKKRPLSAFELASQDAINNAKAIKEKYDVMLMQIEGVVGHAVGLSEADAQTPVILVLVFQATDDLRAKLPQNLDGVAVEVLEVGQIKAL